MKPADLEERTRDAAAALRTAGFYVSVDGCTDTRGAAALLHIAEKTLRNRRAEGRSPRANHRVAGRLFFRIEDLLRLRDVEDVPT